MSNISAASTSAVIVVLVAWTAVVLSLAGNRWGQYEVEDFPFAVNKWGQYEKEDTPLALDKWGQRQVEDTLGKLKVSYS